MTREFKRMQEDIREIWRQMTLRKCGAMFPAKWIHGEMVRRVGEKAAGELSTFYGYGESADPPLSKIMLVENITSSPLMCDFHCGYNDGRFVGDVTPETVATTPIDVMKETAECLAAYSAAMPNGFTESERLRVRAEIADARTALDRLEYSMELAAI